MKHIENEWLNEELSKIKANELKKTGFTYANHNNNTIITYLEALKDNTSVCLFSIHCDSFSKNELSIIADFVIKRNNIEKIELWNIKQYSKNKAKDLAKLAIFTDLFKTKFSILEFSLCEIRSKGAQILSEALYNNNYLKKIRLSCNKIGDQGLKLILEALVYSETIEELNFNQNEITDEGTLYIGQFLVVNKSIIDLDLFGN